MAPRDFRRRAMSVVLNSFSKHPFRKKSWIAIDISSPTLTKLKVEEVPKQRRKLAGKRDRRRREQAKVRARHLG